MSLGLVSGWAQYNPLQQQEWGAYAYLNRPSWKTNIFAWHAVLLVAGFFMSQVFALSGLAFFGEKKYAIITNFFWQFGALTTLIAGMRAVVKYNQETDSDSLITMHSWIGVICIVFWAFSFLYGKVIGVGGLMGVRFQSSATFTHIALSVITLVLTFVCIVSGINAVNGEHGCDFLKQPENHNTRINSAYYYLRMPWGCKVSNGLGLAVLFSTVFTVYALMASRSVALFDDSELEKVESADDVADVADVEMTQQE